MSSRRQSQFSQAASAVALSAATEAEIGPAPRLIDSDMGDSASREAIERLNAAIADLRQLKVQPLLQRALAAIKANDHKSAADLALKALHRDERSGLGWYILAVAREKAGDFKGSIACFESALALMPNHADIANDLGRLAFRMGLKQEAAKLFAHYRAANPDCPQGANNVACALRDLHDYNGAIEVLRPAIMAHPEDSALWNTLGTVLSEQGQAAGSVTFFEAALRVDPNFAKARYNLSNARLDLGDLAGALADCDTAMQTATDPSDLAMMRLARSTILLCMGRVKEGWDAYEARLDPHFAGITNFMIDRPRWSPGMDLSGRTFLLMGEQGLGDEVSFLNPAHDILQALGPEGRLLIAVEPRLIKLFERSFPDAIISPHSTFKVDGHTVRGAPHVDHASVDLWAPMASMLREFRASAEAYPDHRGYLTPDPERVAHWRGLLDALPGPKVGLVWKSLKLDGARLKQFSPFEQWRPVLETPGATFVNLQYGDCETELAEARAQLGVEIWRPPEIDLKNDLDDVAALCCAMDLIIGPSNATSSIAGACGAPLWLLSTPGAWPRLGTDRYPCYATSRAFIPDGFDQWDLLMPKVAEALTEEIAAYQAGTRSA